MGEGVHSASSSVVTECYLVAAKKEPSDESDTCSGSSSDDFFPEILYLPPWYNDNAKLKFEDITGFKTAEKVKLSLQFDMSSWANKKEVFALLTNHEVFGSTFEGDFTYRKHRYLAKSENIGVGVCTGHESTDAFTEEVWLGQLEVWDGVTLEVYETVGS